MSYTEHELKTTYDPTDRASWANFVLYAEPDQDIVTTGLHSTTTIEHTSPYVQEWMHRLRGTRPRR
ncbi:hypothetical protein ACIQOV_36475 [Kitasatospora sp. NPDC091257]|uniref:hypothetical protein n=1 Tax=Kitasatospora sp. NPDC091257 TaxID=3364084 RepID=UPI00382B72FC